MDQRQGAVYVFGTLRVEGDDVGAGPCEIGNDAVHRLDHQMHVDRGLRQGADGLTDQRADSQVRHVVVVHHVEMNPVRTGSDDIHDLLPELGEIGGKDAWRNDVHGRNP